MSWIRIWVHLVFATKNREAYLHPEIRKQVFQHIKQNAEEKAIWLDSVNGFSDHAHCLLSLNKNQTISDVVQLIKGESSFWINKNKLTKNNFHGRMIIGLLALVKVIYKLQEITSLPRKNIIRRKLLLMKL